MTLEGNAVRNDRCSKRAKRPTERKARRTASTWSSARPRRRVDNGFGDNDEDVGHNHDARLGGGAGTVATSGERTAPVTRSCASRASTHAAVVDSMPTAALNSAGRPLCSVNAPAARWNAAVIR